MSLRNNNFFQRNMFFFVLCQILILKGISASQFRDGMQLCRAQGNFDDSVLNYFYDREDKGQEFWIRNNKTIDFVMFEEEGDKVSIYLKEHGVVHSVLMKNVAERMTEKLVKKFPLRRAGTSASQFRDGMQLCRAQGNFNDSVLNYFYDREDKGQEFWIRNNKTIDFVMFEEEGDKVSIYLKEHGVVHSVLMKNVAESMTEKLVKKIPLRRAAGLGDSFSWTGFPALREINAYLVNMARKYSTHCKLYTLGKTVRGKPIYMLRISNGNHNNKAILVDGGMHGREWMSVISALYFIDNLVRNYTQQPAYITKKHWHIIPVLNPDGYEYSLSSDHLWKKNRKRLSGGCVGVDLNRNFDYNFDKADVGLCNAQYGGPVPFSEEETKALKKLADETHFYGYLSIHSAGSKVLYPLGMWASSDEHHKHITTTRLMAQAMRKVDNYVFDNGDMHKMGKNNYGMAMDWMYFEKEVPYSYTIETRGQNGLDFIQPKHILVAAKEVRAGLMKFAETLL